jgi:hypothetical protein
MASSNNSTLNPAADTQPVMLSPEELVRELRALRERIPIPNLTPAPAGLRRRLSHVNADFVTASVNAAGVSEAVQKSVGRSDEDLRQEIDAAGRWAAAIDEVRALLHSMALGNTIRKQRIGLAALQTYQICQQLARDESHEARLAVHITEMKRLNRFGRTRRKQEPAPAPQPEPATEAKTQ